MKTMLLRTAAAGSLCLLALPAHAAIIEQGPGHPVSSASSSLSYDFSPSSLIQSAQFDDDDYDDDDWRDRRRYRDGRRQRIYDDRGRYAEPRRLRRGDRIWRGRDGRYYCRRDNGTTGLVIGAGVGALLGRTIDTRGDRTVGTLLGGALGAVLGRELDRGKARCR